MTLTRTVYQAAAVAVREAADHHEVFVVRSRRNPTDWIFPKGHIEQGETAAQAAVRELLEEGGIVGIAEEPIGVSTVVVESRRLEIAYFKVRFAGEGTAVEHREKRWVSFDEARSLLTYEDARRYVSIVERLVRGRHA